MPDVSILVYAHRADDRVHAPYRAWLERLINGREPFALSPLVAVGFVRIVTNPKIYTPATPLAAAVAAIDQMASHPRCVRAVLGPSHWEDVAGLCRAANATGKAVADAQHAAVAIAEGATWVTRDADFARFAPHGLSWEHLELGD